MALARDASLCSSTFIQMPWNVPGDIFICGISPWEKPAHVARFRSCCDGPIVNVTTRVPPTDISWPATCFAWCATHDSGFNPKTEHNPYGFSDHFLCLTNDLEDTLDFSVICGNSSNYAATASAAKDIPTSTYGHSWSVASWTGSSTTSRYVQGTAVSTVTGSVSSGTKKSSSTMAAVTTGVGTTSTTTTGLSSSLSGTTASSVATASSRSSADGGVSRSNGFLLASMGLLALLGYGW